MGEASVPTLRRTADENSVDRPSEVVKKEVIGRLNMTLEQVRGLMSEFAAVTNKNDITYRPTGSNRNSYAFTFVQSLGFKRPAPFGCWAPRPGAGTPTSRLSYFGKIKPK